MLVAALRSDNPLGGAPLTCDESAESFTLQGLGQITAAKLLDLENRRQLVWGDPVTREWVLETAAIRVRKAAAAKAAAAVEAAALAAAQEQASASGVVRVGAGAGTLVFGPPVPQPSSARRPAGIRPTQTRFAAPAADAGGPRRVVWSEPPAAAAAPQTAVTASAGAPGAPTPFTTTPFTTTPFTTTPFTTTPFTTTPFTSASDAAAMSTRRVDRMRSRKEVARRKALLPARLATAPGIVVFALLAVLAVVVLFAAAHGVL